MCQSSMFLFLSADDRRASLKPQIHDSSLPWSLSGGGQSELFTFLRDYIVYLRSNYATEKNSLHSLEPPVCHGQCQGLAWNSSRNSL